MYPFSFLESIRIENKFAQNLEWHQRRITDTLRAHESNIIIHLEQEFSKLKIPCNGVHKWRIIYKLTGIQEMELQRYQQKIYTEFCWIEAPEIQYSFKYKNRNCFANLVEGDTVLPIITQNNCITDTVFSNLVFLKNETWYTPEAYILNGTQRQFLLSTQKIQSCKIQRQNLRAFSSFKLINAMLPLEKSHPYPIAFLLNFEE